MVSKVYKYADGGKVISSESSTDKPKPPPKPPTGDTIQSPKPASTVDALKNQRARQMKELGLKDGGPVKRPLPKPPEKMPADTFPLPPPQKGEKPKRIGAPYRDGGKVKPNMNAPLGQGGRFAAVAAAAKRSGARNPNAVAAAVGRKSLGAKKMAKLAAAGRKRRS